MAAPQPRIPFVQLMALEAVAGAEDRYVSKTLAWAPGHGWGNAFGGHVYAQAVWAAAQNVKGGLVVHNVHGFFTLPGLVDRPFVYKVDTVSNGRTYCTRSVSVRQPKDACLSFQSGELGNICFTCICSFKRDEPKSVNHQEVKNLEEEYSLVLRGKKHADHNESPGVDAPWYRENLSRYASLAPCPGLDIRKVDMSSYNASKIAHGNITSYRQLHYYRSRYAIPLTSPNLHACAHLFASDRNSLYLISNALEIGNQIAKMGSLSHSVVFHVQSKELLLLDDETWFCQEAWTARSEGGRGMHESKIWNEKGLHVASTWQDGMVRKADLAELELKRERGNAKEVQSKL